MCTTQTIKKYLKWKRIPIQEFLRMIGKSPSYLNSTKDFSIDVLKQVLVLFPDLNIEWLLTGEGEMLKTPSAGGQVVANGDSSVAAMNSHVTTSPSPTVEQLRTELKLKDQVLEEKERLIKILLANRS